MCEKRTGGMDVKGYIQTVTGRMPADEMGMTLTHEHVLCDSAPDSYTGDGALRTENLSAVRWAIHSLPENLRMIDE